jgi:glycosyltransferase involved in cell wall biosynthesis
MGIKLGDNRMEIKSSSLTIVIPAFNESEGISINLPGVLEFCKVHHWKLIIVNDGSTDNTTEILQKFENQPRLTVIHHKINRGYGGALKTGLMAVDTDYAVTIDADGQHQLSDIEKLLDLMMEKDADMIVGCRVGQSKTIGTGNWENGSYVGLRQ